MAASEDFLAEMATAQNKLLEDFRGITGTDDSIATSFMEESFWDLDQAVNAFFDSHSHDIDVGIPESSGIQDDDAAQQISDPSSLKLLSWNVDGLDLKNLQERTKAVVSLINNQKPDIVYLQEVVPETLAMYQQLCKGYECINGFHSCPAYFNAILYNKTTIKSTAPPSCTNFAQSQMGRHLLSQPVIYRDKSRLVLITSHLESTAKCSAERKHQLHEVLNKIAEQDISVTVLFAGDTNLRDKEVSIVVDLQSRSIVDVWDEWGQNPETKYTWDTSVNDNLDTSHFSNHCKLRFDRMFLREGLGQNCLKPFKFSLVGKERVPSCGRFPSDHWGILCEFYTQ